MKIRESKLRQIIREEMDHLLRESDVRVDIVDNIKLGWPDKAAEAALDKWGSYAEVKKWLSSAPSEMVGVDDDALEDFLDHLDWEERQRERQKVGGELSAISDVFTFKVSPDEVEYIVYQPRMKGGKLHRIDMEDGSGGDVMLGNMTTSMDRRDARKAGTTLEKVLQHLEQGGARLQKRRRSARRSSGSYYD
jgi:hypothetical protein